MDPPKLNRRFFAPLLVVIIIVMMGQNYFLVRKNNDSLRRIDLLSEEINKRSVMPAGQLMSSFYAIDMDSQRVIIDPQKRGKKKLFFVFATWCGACVKNMDQWNSLAASVHALNHAEVIGLCPDAISRIRSYYDSLKLSFPVFSVSVDSSILEKYKFQSFPQTVLVDTAGSVIRVWPGVLSDGKRKEVENSV